MLLGFRIVIRKLSLRLVTYIKVGTQKTSKPYLAFVAKINIHQKRYIDDN